MTTDQEQFDFWFSVLFYTTFSGLGSLFIIYEILRSHRKDINARLVLYLAIADFCLSFICLGFCSYHLHHGSINLNSIACKAQPVITWYLMEASILWLTTIAIHSALLIVKNQKITLRTELIANLVCWGLPIVTVMIPLDSSTGEEYGDRNGLWCSFSVTQAKSQIVNLLVYYVPCLTIIVSCYGMIGYQTYKTFGANEVTGTSRTEVNSIVRRLFCYVACYFFIWTPLVICYIYEVRAGKYIPFWAEYISANLLHIQGIANGVIYYLLNDNFISSLRNKYLYCQKRPRLDSKNEHTHSPVSSEASYTNKV